MIISNICSDYNQIARVQNSLLQTSTDDLFLLVNPVTNTAVDGFPSRPQDIADMQHGELDGLLEQLGLPAGGRESQKRARLRIHIGLRKIPGALPA